MKISDRRECTPRTTFNKLSNGDVFEYGGRINFVTHVVCLADGKIFCNAVDLHSGSMKRFEPHDVVTKIDCELVLRENMVVV